VKGICHAASNQTIGTPDTTSTATGNTISSGQYCKLTVGAIFK